MNFWARDNRAGLSASQMATATRENHMSEHEYRDGEDVQTAIRSLFLGWAPERAEELEVLWQELSPKFQLTQNVHEGGHIVMEAGMYRYVRFNHRVLRAFWIAGYAAWEGFSAVQRSLARASTLDLESFRELIAAFEMVISSDSPELEPLPPGVSEPGSYVDKDQDMQGRAAGELTTIAVGWALLHEVRHLRHQREGTSADPYEADPINGRAEELSCDAFATRFLLERVEAYAQCTHEDLELVRRKRQLGIYFALFAMTLIAKDKWDDSNTHPALQTRILAVHEAMKPGVSMIALAISQVAFAALNTVWPKAPGAMSGVVAGGS